MGSQGVGARTLLMPEPAPLPATIGPYRIVEMLGAGGMGAVYKGLDVSLERHVAIKVLSPALATDAESRERFLREARSAAVLSHPNVVSVYQIGEDAGRPYIAMELIDGSSLEDLLVERRRIPAPLAIAYVLQVVDGLDAAWKRGIVHRDIKPGNILIHADGYAKLADFGLSKAYGGDKSLTQSGMVMGTPRYMSPEQGEGKPLDFRSDVYSLGATLYHMLAGSPPYDADTPVSVIVKHITSPIPSISAKDPSLPEPVCRVIEHMLQKRAEDRPATYDELREELRFARDSLGAGPGSTATGEAATLRTSATLGLAPTVSLDASGRRADAPASRKPGAILILGVLLAVVALALPLTLRRVFRPRPPADRVATPAVVPSSTPPPAERPVAPAPAPTPPATEAPPPQEKPPEKILEAALDAQSRNDSAAARSALTQLERCIASGACADIAPSAQAALATQKARDGDADGAIAAFNRALSLSRDPSAAVQVVKDGHVTFVPLHEKMREELAPLGLTKEKAAGLVPNLQSGKAQLAFADRVAAVATPASGALTIASYEAVMHRFPADATAYARASTEVAVLLLKSGEREAAREHLEAVVAHLEEIKAPWSELNDALFLSGTVHGELGDLARADEEIRRAREVSADPSDPVTVISPDGKGARRVPIELAVKAAMTRLQWRDGMPRPRRGPEGPLMRPRDRMPEKGAPPER